MTTGASERVISSPDDQVLVETSEGIATVTLNDPARKNALTPASADRLVEVLDGVDADSSVGALVVRGAGGTFCSGADLSVLGSAMDDPTSEESYNALDRIYRAFTRLGEMNVPTIAAVRGSAVGAGVNMLMAADVRIVADDARIISGFLKIGLHPGGGHFQLLVQGSSREAATVMGVLSQEINGQRAAELGLAWEALGDALVEDRAHELAKRAGADPDLARKAIRSLRLTTPTQVPWATALQAERAAQLWSLRRAAVRRSQS
jgi:enoyl-CoA hydratase/carnithine racemase